MQINIEIYKYFNINILTYEMFYCKSLSYLKYLYKRGDEETITKKLNSRSA